MTEILMQVRDVSISYDNRPVLRGVNLDIPAGRITALIGPSGCGKTSFLNSLNRMTDLVSGCRVDGCICLEGQSIHDPRMDINQLRCTVGMIFQRPNPFPLSIRENIHLPLREHGVGSRRKRDEQTEHVLRETGLWDEVRDRLDQPALRLSGGQRQRLCVARALTLRPRVLLLDEPCSSLDPPATEKIEQLLRTMRGRVTQVIVTHNLAQARRLADEVVVFWLRDGCGRMIESGPAESIFRNPQHPDTAAYLAGRSG